MSYIYLPYIIILTLFITVECKRHHHSFLWVAATAFIPLAGSMLLFKTRGWPGIRLILLSFTFFIAAAGTEVYLFNISHEQHQYRQLPPILKQVIRLNENVKHSTVKIYDLSSKLDSISMVQSRISDIQTTLELIAILELEISNNQMVINNLIDFLNKKHTYLSKKNITWVFSVKKFYQNPIVLRHNEQRSSYYTALKNLLTYTKMNFGKIMKSKSQVHRKNYNVYYMRYRRAADKLNRINRERIQYQHEFIQKFSEVAPLLPGKHQIEPFRFWDKFSF